MRRADKGRKERKKSRTNQKPWFRLSFLANGHVKGLLGVRSSRFKSDACCTDERTATLRCLEVGGVLNSANGQEIEIFPVCKTPRPPDTTRPLPVTRRRKSRGLLSVRTRTGGGVVTGRCLAYFSFALTPSFSFFPSFPLSVSLYLRITNGPPRSCRIFIRPHGRGGGRGQRISGFSHAVFVNRNISTSFDFRGKRRGPEKI